MEDDSVQPGGPSSATTRPLLRVKNACRSCQKRKKKCNAAKPICALCAKYRLTCEYGGIDSSKPNVSSGPASSPTGAANMFSETLSQQPPLVQASSSGIPEHFELSAQTAGDGHLHDLYNSSLVAPFGLLDHAETDFLSEIPSVSTAPASRFSNEMTSPDPSSALSQHPYTCQQTPASSTPRNPSTRSEFSDDPAVIKSVAPAHSPLQLEKSRLLSIIRHFFTHCHHLLPILRMDKILDGLREQPATVQVDPLISIMIAVVCRKCPDQFGGHQSSELGSKAAEWATLAFVRSVPSLSSIQTALWVILHQSMCGNFASAWIYMALVWRMACLLHYNTIDECQSNDDTVLSHDENKEMIRATMWSMLLVERNLFSLTSRAFSVDEGSFHVRMPADGGSERLKALDQHDVRAADANARAPRIDSTRSNISLDGVVAKSWTVQSHLYKAYTLLGQVSSYVFNGADDQNRSEGGGYWEELRDRLASLRVQSPQRLSTLCTGGQEIGPLELSCVLASVTILLYYHSKASPWNVSTISLATKSQGRIHDLGKGFERCLLVAKNIVSTLMDILTVSVEPLGNPRLCPHYFLCGYMYVLAWQLSGAEEYRVGVDTIISVLEQVVEGSDHVGHKYNTILWQMLKKTEGQFRSDPVRDIQSLLQECSKALFS